MPVRNVSRKRALGLALPFALAVAAAELSAQTAAGVAGAPTPEAVAPSLVFEPTGFDWIGVTLLDDSERAEVLAPFIGRPLSTADLQALLDAIRARYATSGYGTTEVGLPDQDLADGRIVLEVHEGRIEEMAVEGARFRRPAYYRARLRRAAGLPLHVPSLYRELERLQADPEIERVDAVLERIAPGRARLRLEVEERPPWSASARFSNHRSPSVGSPGGVFAFRQASLAGFGEQLTLQAQVSEGIRDFGLRFDLPFVFIDTRAFVAYRRGDADVVERDFEAAGIGGRFESIALGLRHPVVWSPAAEIWLELAGEWRQGASTLLGRPYCFQADLRDCEPTVAALRLGQEFVHRGRSRALAARSTLSIGLDVLDATAERASSERDGEFVAWLVALQWLERLPEIDGLPVFDGSELAGRFDLQLADDPLLSVEQIAVGGGTSVRGYRENQLVRDGGLVGSLELRVPILRTKFAEPILSLAPFVDFGSAWDRRRGANERKTESIASSGLALRLALGESWRAELSWAHAFQNRDPASGLQGEGIFFEVVWHVF